MHLSSIEKMQRFRNDFLAGMEDLTLKILDFGSMAIGGSYRSIFDCSGWEYTGTDIRPGENVDIVLSDPYSWLEIDSDSVDVVVSGQTFEHIEFFWQTMLEMARVLRPGGLCCLIAPSGGPEHRYPVDCWRFYPDGFRALAKYANLDPLKVETHWYPEGYADGSREWADTWMVARKPVTVIADEGAHVYRREIVAGDPEDSLTKIKKYIAPRTTVLELGPATGYLTRYLKEELDCQVDCVELSPEMARETEKYCRKMVVSDLDKTELLSHFEESSYDVVVIADVIEHLVDGEKTLNSCRRLIKKEGRCVISFPNIAHVSVVGSLLKGRFDYTDEGLLDKTHLRFYTKANLIAMANRCGFSVECLESVIKLPEDTEMADSLTDLPAETQRLLFEREDALVYQFILVCAPTGPVAAGNNAVWTSRPTSAIDLRRSFLVSQQERIDVLDERLLEAQTLAHDRMEKLQDFETRFEEVKQLALERMVKIQKIEDALRNAQELAFSRMDEVTHLAAALAEAQRMAFERAHKILELEKVIADWDALLGPCKSRIERVLRSKAFKFAKQMKKRWLSKTRTGSP